MIRDITEKLYSGNPEGTLYHYTTFTGLMGIVKRGVLWASDIRYMNDSAELKHTADLIRTEVSKRIADGHENPNLLNQFLDWVTHRITNGNMVFAASFRSHGNLLSQWRGYSRVGKGVSLGFNADAVLQCAKDQSFQIGKCIYDPHDQAHLIKKVIDAVENFAQQAPHITQTQSRTDYHDIFEKIESDLLRIAAILKHPSFQEEEEWRIVSSAITDYINAPVLFREGHSMLVPYFEFALTRKGQTDIAMDHIFLGPTPNINISMNSLTLFLTKNGINPEKGISYCQIPFRQK